MLVSVYQCVIAVAHLSFLASLLPVQQELHEILGGDWIRVSFVGSAILFRFHSTKLFKGIKVRQRQMRKAAIIIIILFYDVIFLCEEILRMFARDLGS